MWLLIYLNSSTLFYCLSFCFLFFSSLFLSLLLLTEPVEILCYCSYLLLIVQPFETASGFTGSLVPHLPPTVYLWSAFNLSGVCASRHDGAACSHTVCCSCPVRHSIRGFVSLCRQGCHCFYLPSLGMTAVCRRASFGHSSDLIEMDCLSFS